MGPCDKNRDWVRRSGAKVVFCCRDDAAAPALFEFGSLAGNPTDNTKGANHAPSGTFPEAGRRNPFDTSSSPRASNCQRRQGSYTSIPATTSAGSSLSNINITLVPHWTFLWCISRAPAEFPAFSRSTLLAQRKY